MNSKQIFDQKSPHFMQINLFIVDYLYNTFILYENLFTNASKYLRAL